MGFKRKRSSAASYARKKRRFAKRKWGRKRRGNVFNKAPMPNKFASKLRYQEVVSVNPGAAGTAGVYVFSANGIFDPNYTGTGHQPRGFDQLMTMYDHYTVIGAKIVVDFISEGSYDNICWIALKDSSTADADPNDYLEARNVVSTMLPHSGTGGNTTTRRLSKKYSTRKFLGRSKPMSDPELKGSTSSNPAEQAWFHIGIAPTTSVDESAMNIQVRLEYLVVFHEPRQPTQS